MRALVFFFRMYIHPFNEKLFAARALIFLEAIKLRKCRRPLFFFFLFRYFRHSPRTLLSWLLRSYNAHYIAVCCSRETLSFGRRTLSAAFEATPSAAESLNILQRPLCCTAETPIYTHTYSGQPVYHVYTLRFLSRIYSWINISKFIERP